MNFKKYFRPILIIIIDFITFILSGFIILTWINYFKKILSSIPQPDVLLTYSLEEVKAIMDTNPGLMINISIILLVLSFIILFSISKTFVYRLTKKLTLKDLINHFTINLSFYFIVFIPVSLIAIIMKQGADLVFVCIMLLLFIHYSIALNMLLLDKISFKQIINALKFGTKKAHYFVLAYIIFIIIWIILFIISSIIPIVYLLTLLTAVLLYFTRYYMIRLIPRKIYK